MIKLLTKTAQEAGDKLAEYFTNGFRMKHKNGQHDLVTDADICVQKLIKQRLLTGMKQQGYKEHEIGFIGEEGLYKPGKYTFVIDPLDGTNNFASGYLNFASSLALFQDNKLVAGAVCLPCEQALYYGEQGKGAYREVGGNRVQLQVSYQELRNSLLGTYFSSNNALRKRMIKMSENIFPMIRGLRQTGTVVADLCKFTDNVFNVVIYGRTNIWDIAAMVLIGQEAGGSISDWQGQTIKFNLKKPQKKYPILVCHPHWVTKITKIINDA